VVEEEYGPSLELRVGREAAKELLLHALGKELVVTMKNKARLAPVVIPSRRVRGSRKTCDERSEERVEERSDE